MKLPFGLRDGTLLHVSDVDSGLACGCTCPCCGAQLVARKGSKVIHHFAHHSVVECEGALQTALHIKAKEILERRREVMLPAVPVRISGRYSGEIGFLSPAKLIVLDKVVLEAAEVGFVPDLTVYIGDRRMFIEIRVTHAVDAAKLSRMKKTGAAVLEIDLSKSDRDFDPATLEGLLVGATGGKVWLFNPKAADIERWLAKNAERKVIGRGFGALTPVRGCPISKDSVDLLTECQYCPYFWDAGGPQDEGHWPTELFCTGRVRAEVDKLYAKIKNKDGVPLAEHLKRA
jgi:hypothetical protein